MSEGTAQEQALARQLAQMLAEGSGQLPSCATDGRLSHDGGSKGDELIDLGQAAVLLRNYDRFELGAQELELGLRQLDVDFEGVQRASLARGTGVSRSWRQRLLWLPLPLVGALAVIFWMNLQGTVSEADRLHSLHNELARLQARMIAARVQGDDVPEDDFASGMRSYRGQLMATLEASER